MGLAIAPPNDGFRFAQPILPIELEFCRRLTSDPNRSSLGLLPSGPDPVGEWLAHRQPPGPYIGGTAPDCKRGSRVPDFPPGDVADCHHAALATFGPLLPHAGLLLF